MDLSKGRINQIENKSSSRRFEDFRTLSYKIMNHSNLGLPLTDFLRKLLNLLMDFSGCDAVELWVRDGEKYIHIKVSQGTSNSFQHEMVTSIDDDGNGIIPNLPGDSIINRILIDTIRGQYDPSLPFCTQGGSFWTGDTEESFVLMRKSAIIRNHNHNFPEDYRSLAFIPIIGENENIGVLQMMKRDLNFFTEEETEFYESIAQILWLAMINQRSRSALRERIKEITCLYNISKVTERQDISFAEMLQNIVEIIPPAWQYPEITSGRIILDGHTYSTSGFEKNKQNQTSAIIVNGEQRGTVEIIYTKNQLDLDEGPFLKEERNLIDTIARQLSHMVERQDEKEGRSRLQEQLRHADRLATIGQFAAGIAHEFNEPLNSILGFAQLIKKDTELPVQVEQDVQQIEKASLFAREIIKKLMLFSRQTQPKITQLNLNDVITEGLYFLQSRCDKAGIHIEFSLAPGIPKIAGDQTQLNQVLVNLVVNSIQAMPDGGKLTIKTLYGNDYVSLIVEDTGVGIKKEVIDKIFIPFFTTKDVSEGTGLGLAVAHGIVTLHKGSIRVESRINYGTRFEIRLPRTQL